MRLAVTILFLAMVAAVQGFFVAPQTSSLTTAAPSSSALYVFGTKKDKRDPELESKFWQGEWVCKVRLP